MSDIDPASNMRHQPKKNFEMLTPGEKFGDYQILKCVSRDLFGSLYDVRKAKEEVRRCIFLLPPMVNKDEQFVANFEAKANELLSLDHEHILAYTEHEVIKERYCLYCEAFTAENLEAYALSHATPPSPLPSSDNAKNACGLPQDEVRTILKQVVEALRFAHEKQIFHLNLVPLNILRDSQGHIKVVGFGLMNMAGKELFENLVSAGIAPIALNTQPVRINTLDILAPEMRLGEDPDQRADIYALGITAYWLLTGTKPASKYQPPSDLVDDLLPGWDILIDNCLESKPSARYQHVAHVLQDLNDLDKLTDRSTYVAVNKKEANSGFKLLEFIPVPQQLTEKGIAYTRAFRLGIIGCTALFLFALIATLFNPDTIHNNDTATAAIVTTPAGEEPKLIVHVVPSHARVRFIDENLSFTNKEGTIKLNIPPGDYQLEVTAPQHQKYTQSLQITAEPQTLNAHLERAFGMLTIHTLAEATATAIDENGARIPLGQANASGMIQVVEKLPQGTYTINVHKPNHVRTSRQVTLLSEPQLETFPLPGEPGTLRVRSNPRGAIVKIEGEVLGTTNLTVEDLPVGKRFIVTVGMEGYRSISKAVTLKPGTRTPLDFGDLVSEHGSLRPVITVDNQPISPELAQALTIEVNDQPWPGTTEVIENLAVGVHQLTIAHPDYQTLTPEFNIADNTVVELNLDLTPKPATLVIQNSPSNIKPQLKINGQLLEMNPDNRYVLKPGKYHLSLSAHNYFTTTKQLQLKPDETFTWEAVMQPIPAPQISQDYTIPYTLLKLTWIQPGTFSMGSPPRLEGSLPTDGPQTTMTLTQGYWIGTFEVTQQQFKHITGRNPSNFNHSPQYPVDSVNWKQAMRFCNMLHAREAQAGRIPSGYAYRLPTEAEWEYAARAGSTTPFHWGDTADRSHANMTGSYPRDYATSAITTSNHYGTMKVGSFQPNAFGLYDVHGNVSEWCMDYYNARLPGGSKINWHQTQQNPKRSHRGGGWEYFAVAARACARGTGASESTASEAIGFRVVLGPILDE